MIPMIQTSFDPQLSCVDACSHLTAFIDDKAQIRLDMPAHWTRPLMLLSPHSGRQYAAKFQDQAALSQRSLRRAEDAYVDLLIQPNHDPSYPILSCQFPRSYVDVNRGRDEIDPAMIQRSFGFSPIELLNRTERVRNGFGVIPRCIGPNRSIYKSKLTSQEIEKRLKRHYDPFHMTLKSLIEKGQEKFTQLCVLDFHSMPSLDFENKPLPDLASKDIIIGSRFHQSADAEMTYYLGELFAAEGLNVTHNAPFAGGYVTEKYGQPDSWVHMLQIEINRQLYLDETSVTRHEGFAALRKTIRQIVQTFAQDVPQYFPQMDKAIDLAAE